MLNVRNGISLKKPSTYQQIHRLLLVIISHQEHNNIIQTTSFHPIENIQICCFQSLNVVIRMQYRYTKIEYGQLYDVLRETEK